MFSRLGLSLIVTLTLAIGTADSLIPVAMAATNWDVQVGGDVPGAGLTANAFLPSVLTIHVGDTVVWTQASSLVPHSVTFLDGSPRLPDFVPNPSTPGELLLGPAEFARGRQEPATAYTGAGLVNSGNLTPPDASPFRMSFSRPGVYAYACMYHPGMNGTIQVLPETAALAETPQQASARGSAQVEALAAQLKADLQSLRPTHADVLGAMTVHVADAGLSTGAGGDNAGGMSALRFLPDVLAVHRGDLVIWTLADPLEIHTITFTSEALPPPLVDVRPQPTGPPQLVLTANVSGPAGGSTYTGDGYINSGILYPGESFALLVDAPAGTYEYLCLVHDKMKGTLSVTE